MKKTYIEIILIFLVLCLFSFLVLAGPSKTSPPLSFDNQALLVWEYTASIDMFPYRDIFYPYGILQYFKNQNIFFAIIYFLLTPTLFLGVFLTLRRLFTNKSLSYFLSSLFFLFVITTTGLETFNRYGVVVILSLLFAHIFFYGQKFLFKYILLTGILVGIIFSLINDQGVYSIIVFFIFILADGLLMPAKTNRLNIFFSKIIKEASIFITGLSIGITPFFMYLASQNSLSQFIMYLKQLPEISLYAKTPFFHSIINFDNIFTLTALFITLSYLVYRILISNKKPSFNTYIQIGLVCILILLEQKNIIRSMSTQLTFIGLLLYISLFYEIKNKYSLYVPASLILICGIILYIIVQGHPTPNNSIKQKNLFENSTMPKVYRKLQAMGVTKIFSFPGNPVFYILFNQKPPYYLSTYESSPAYAQQGNINYLQHNHINTVIYNTAQHSLQDEVPEYVRASLELSYILTQYEPVTSVHNYYILKQKPNIQLTKAIKKHPDFYQPLLNIELQTIPYSEGFYKAKAIQKKQIVLEAHDQPSINKFLAKTHLSSHNITPLVRTLSSDSKQTKLSIATKNGIVTHIRFKSCKDFPCIINLARIPLFYQDSEITSINSNQPIEIKIVTLSHPSPLW